MRAGGLYKQDDKGKAQQTHKPAPDPKVDEAAQRRAKSATPKAAATSSKKTEG